MTSVQGRAADGGHRCVWWFSLAAIVLAAIAVWAVLLVMGRDERAAWRSATFSEYSAIITVLAFASAAAAFYVAFVPYRRWVADQARRPSIVLWAAIEHGGEQTAERIDGEAVVPGLDIHLKVVVENNGDAAVVGGILNVVVPAECRLDVDPPATVGHRLMPMVHQNSEINEHAESPPMSVRFTVVERDFTPNHFIYWVRIRTPHPMRCPVLLALDGDPPPRARELVHIATAGWQPADEKDPD